MLKPKTAKGTFTLQFNFQCGLKKQCRKTLYPFLSGALREHIKNLHTKHNIFPMLKGKISEGSYHIV